MMHSVNGTEEEVSSLVESVDPRTGFKTSTGIRTSSVEETAHTCQRAAEASLSWATVELHQRADALERIAREIEHSTDSLVTVAEGESGLSRARLTSEVGRSVTQFRLFASAVREGSHLELAIDHADDSVQPPAPDIRRRMIPLGVVAVFGSSNFPFAFSVLGGDTASALASGNAVVLKAHSAHPAASEHSFDVLVRGLGAEYPGVVGIVYGQEAGRQLVKQPNVKAVGFTGSLGAGKILMDAIAEREDPIPFYGELASVNPLVVLPGAAKSRGEHIGNLLAESVLGSAGQLCTKPGVAFVPRGAEGDQLVQHMRLACVAQTNMVLLNERVRDGFVGATRSIMQDPAIKAVVSGTPPSDGAFLGRPHLLMTDTAELSGATLDEAFGPLIVVVRYGTVDDVLAALHLVPPSLTATIHGEDGDAEEMGILAKSLMPRAGRLVFNGFPTGVRVSWAQNHGGPWPATNTVHTSVGVASMRRFLRPMVWQNASEHLLPEVLRQPVGHLPIRVDGVLRPGAASRI